MILHDSFRNRIPYDTFFDFIYFCSSIASLDACTSLFIFLKALLL
jgi:hypothetical protein